TAYEARFVNPLNGKTVRKAASDDRPTVVALARDEKRFAACHGAKAKVFNAAGKLLDTFDLGPRA
ncbi:MAG: hypothetical protein K2W96_15345, partial [Gemmataceae bacterium]|nr:hypothetical protein [Gemmataceae bacterium]